MSLPDWVEPVADYMLTVGLPGTLKIAAIALVGSTVIGLVSAAAVELASNDIFLSPVSVDAERMAQVLGSLLDNALLGTAFPPNGVLFGRQAKSVPALGMQHIRFTLTCFAG